MAVSSGVKKALVWVGVLAGVAALLVGIGHWRAYDLVAGDVVWHTKGTEGARDAVVVRDRLYTYGYDVLTIRDVETGRTITEDHQDGTAAYVGDGGHVVVAGLDTLAVYDRDGELLWQQDPGDAVQPVAVSPDGQVDAVSCRGERGCVTIHFDTDGRRTRRTERTSADFATPTYVGVSRLADEPTVRRVPTVATDFDPGKRAVFQVRDGRRYGPALPTDDDPVTAQAGDLLVSMTRKGGTCTFGAVRAGKKAWTTSTACPDLGFPDIDVFEDRVYVTNRSDDGYDVVTTDLDGRRATSFRIETGPVSDTDRRELTPTPDAVVLALTDRISGYSPTTGRRLWSEELDRWSHDAIEESKKIYPGVEVSGPVVDVYGNGPQRLADLAVGRDVPAYTHAFRDAATGEKTAELAAPYGVFSYGLDDGRVLVIGDDDVWLVAP